jgi:hypothetical protein
VSFLYFTKTVENTKDGEGSLHLPTLRMRLRTHGPVGESYSKRVVASYVSSLDFTRRKEVKQEGTFTNLLAFLVSSIRLHNDGARIGVVLEERGGIDAVVGHVCKRYQADRIVECGQTHLERKYKRQTESETLDSHLALSEH